MKRLGFSAALILLLCGFALGQGQFKVLYTFNGTDGQGPQSLIFDQAGNLYGTTFIGGGCALCGTLFELSPRTDGGWTETVLHNFCSLPSCQDGQGPNRGLVFDRKGNLYGTTFVGGQFGGGTVFELSPSSGGSWTETVLYNFCASLISCSTGIAPRGDLVFDSSGNLFGTTDEGGVSCVAAPNGCGTVFELSPPSSQGGQWTETTLYSFCSTGQGKTCPDGLFPSGGVVMDSKGNLFGATQWGGLYSSVCDVGCGTIYKLSHGSGGWTQSLVLAPVWTVGYEPLGPLTVDKEGRIYGSLFQGGKNHDGSLFRLNPNGKGVDFFFDYLDGAVPEGRLMLSNDVLYGSTYSGGSVNNNGVVFMMTSPDQEAVLYNFCSELNCADGSNPVGMTEDSSGNIFGTTLQGGNESCVYSDAGCGVVYEITAPEEFSKR